MRVQESRLFRATASTVLASFGWMTGGGETWAGLHAARTSPATALARLADDPRPPLSYAQRDALRTAASRLDADLASEAGGAGVPSPARAASTAQADDDAAAEMQRVAEELDRLGAEQSLAARRDQPPEQTRTTIAELKDRWRRTHQEVLDEFAESEGRLRAADVSDLILERHAEALAAYLDEAEAVSRDLDAMAGADAASRAEAVAGRLRRSGNERPHESLDPARLPFRGAAPTRRQPGTPAPVGREGAAADKRAKAAAAGVSTAAVSPPTPADLEPTEDAPITPEIRALAASLDNQPLPIFNWVRNNIEFVPTYGSVQGAAMTLDARRGNAFDTASLLIALLRAAGVHARYVTGTIEVPAPVVMNWVGGAASPREAQQLMGQGGIATVGLVSGDTVTHIRLDHAWVMAFIDYIPSRGAVHRQGDTWVPMDPSFKLHDFTPRSALFTDNPISEIVSPGTRLFDFDEALGKVTNIDEESLTEALQGWVARSDEYAMNRGLPRSVPSLIGGPTVRIQNWGVFPATLPYRTLRSGAAIAELPAALRHYVTVNGYASELDRALGDTAFSVRLSLPALNSRRLGIQFDPATPADADVLAAARAGSAPSLPVYVVNVIPVVKLDGVAQGSGGAVRMGSLVPIDVILEGPDGPTTVSYTQVAGDEIVVGVTGNGVTREVLERRFAANPVANAAEYLHQVQLHYWLECDELGEVAARALGVHMLRLPSVGLFTSPLTVSYLFGAPRSGVYESRIMDVKHSLLAAAADDPARALAFFKQAGLQASYLEGSVFDQLEGRPDTEASIRGISAVHLISIAAKQGIPLYHVTSANAAAVLPLLALDASVESDISRAVAQGQNVLVPERNVTLGPWRGVGYIVRDAATGAGGYLISGGLAGGGLIECLLKKLEPVFRFVLIILAVAFLAFLLALLLAAIWELIPVLALALAFDQAAAGPSLAASGPQAAKEDVVGLLLISRSLAALSVGAGPPP